MQLGMQWEEMYKVFNMDANREDPEWQKVVEEDWESDCQDENEHTNGRSRVLVHAACVHVACAHTHVHAIPTAVRSADALRLHRWPATARM